MITKEKIKTEIDNLKDDYLEILYRIIIALEMPIGEVTEQTETINKQSEWHKFIQETYGCLSETPIERGDQGVYEVREVIG
ncbi:MAG TPA: hypothetical protein ENN22_14750 [bacterium]|nr:hypothetical protein [bacterium]HDQ00424.1 hypothetical protein [bacterium]